MHSRLFVMAVALIISALATVSTSFAVAEFHSEEDKFDVFFT